MQLGLQLGYWGQMPSPDWVERAVEAERLGFTSVWTAEAWGSDALTPLAFLAAKTDRIRLGTSVMQLAARTPTATAMSAITMDYLSNGFATAPIGSYDGINMAANLPPDAQGFRARLPNVPHPPGTAMLPFVNNECKPECCGSTMSCDGGGCVCTTPEDRDLINTRGGNRRHEDGF